MKRIASFGIVFAGVLFLSGCSGQSSSESLETQPVKNPQPKVETPVQVNEEETAETKTSPALQTYVLSDKSFTFVIPQGWNVSKEEVKKGEGSDGVSDARNISLRDSKGNSVFIDVNAGMGGACFDPNKPDGDGYAYLKNGTITVCYAQRYFSFSDKQIGGHFELKDASSAKMIMDEFLNSFDVLDGDKSRAVKQSQVYIEVKELGFKLPFDAKTAEDVTYELFTDGEFKSGKLEGPKTIAIFHSKKLMAAYPSCTGSAGANIFKTSGKFVLPPKSDTEYIYWKSRLDDGTIKQLDGFYLHYENMQDTCTLGKDQALENTLLNDPVRNAFKNVTLIQ